MQNIYFIIPCAGRGMRLGQKIPKQYTLVKQKPLIYYTLYELNKLNIPILLAVSPKDNYINNFHDILPQNTTIAFTGGSTRAITVKNSIEYLLKRGIDSNAWILVHDAARPLVKHEDIKQLIDKCLQLNTGGILAYPISDTLKQVNQDNVTTINRANIFSAQTPQMFNIKLLHTALKQNIEVSDEAMAIEKLGISPLIITGSKNNIKITYPEDLEIFKILIKKRLNI